MLARQTRGNAEAGEPGRAARHVHQDIRWLDVLVDQAPPMDVLERRSDSEGDMQDLSYLKRPPQQPVERLAARICEHQGRAILALRERQRPRRPARVQFSAERVFMLEPLKRLER